MSALRSLALVLASAAAASPAGAVTLNPRGVGQVLVYPYYTANAQFGTLLSIVSTSSDGKALKVRFHEGYNGRVVAAFNLYLSPFDVWVGEVYNPGDAADGGAVLATNDHSCVAPGFLFSIDPGGGPPRLNFDTASYSGANADGGPSGAARTREGYFDVIEMGTVTNATHGTLNAITHDTNGVPADCAQVTAAWTGPAGYWTTDPTIDLAPPSGGLYGAASIIDVAEGLMYTIEAAAIDGFSNAIQHSAPPAAAPDLDTGSATAGGAYAAYVAVGGKLLEAHFTTSVDAVSALFMVDDLYNEYVVNPGIGAQSDWMIAFPTKRFYTDRALLGAGAQARAPFDVPFGSANGGASCAPVGTQFWNREEQTTTTGDLWVCGGCTPPPSPAVCYATSDVAIGSTSSALGSRLVIAGPTYSSSVDLSAQGFTSGWMRVDFLFDSTGNPDYTHALTSTNGLKFYGLPALGFLALDYVNGNVTPGVLANYSGAYPHRAHVTCGKGANFNDPCG